MYPHQIVALILTILTTPPLKKVQWVWFADEAMQPLILSAAHALIQLLDIRQSLLIPFILFNSSTCVGNHTLPLTLYNLRTWNEHPTAGRFLLQRGLDSGAGRCNRGVPHRPEGCSALVEVCFPILVHLYGGGADQVWSWCDVLRSWAQGSGGSIAKAVQNIQSRPTHTRCLLGPNNESGVCTRGVLEANTEGIVPYLLKWRCFRYHIIA